MQKAYESRKSIKSKERTPERPIKKSLRESKIPSNIGLNNPNIGLNNPNFYIPLEDTRKPHFVDPNEGLERSTDRSKSSRKNNWKERTPEKTNFLETLAPYINKIGKDDLAGK